MTTPGKAIRLRRLMTEDSHFAIVAMDQRTILTNMLAELKGVHPSSLPFTDLLAVKKLLVETLSSRASAMLFDPNIAIPAAFACLPRSTGLLVSLEDHRAQVTSAGRKTSSIPGWSVQKIQRLGADGVKLLIWYHPDAKKDVCQHQQDYVRQIGRECADLEMPLVLELLSYHCNADSAAPPATLAEVVLRSVEEFAKPEYQVDLFKLESPVHIPSLGSLGQAGTDPAFREVGHVCAKAGIPWVLLSAGCTTEQFLTVLDHAYAAGAHGFLAGRAIWRAPLQHFPDLQACREKLLSAGVAALNQLVVNTAKNAEHCVLPPTDFSSVSAEGDFALSY